MSVYNLVCYFAAVAVFIAFINYKFGNMQTSIAITTGAVVMSLVIILLGQHDFMSISTAATTLVEEIDFKKFLLQGMLGFLLFAGGLEIKLEHMREQKWEIILLALLATLASTFIIGAAFYGVCLLIALPVPFIYCLLFGALISPTDPIAVLAIVKALHAPRQIATQIEGESLFNDGFGLVIFVTIFGIAFGDEVPTIASVSLLFFQEAIGGILFGLLLGGVFHRLIKATDDAPMELLLTFLIPTSGYALAETLAVSGPLAMVVAGILIGNLTRDQGFSETGKFSLTNFWSLIEEFLNGILFLLIGLAMLTFTFHKEDWLLMAIAIPLVLMGRYLSVKLCYLGFQCVRSYNPMSVKILTWGGLRGGLALAMALSVPAGIMILPDKEIDLREILLVMTYAVVLFSIIIQGSTIVPMINKAKQLQ